jgi:hypothetical protein
MTKIKYMCLACEHVFLSFDRTCAGPKCPKCNLQRCITKNLHDAQGGFSKKQHKEVAKKALKDKKFVDFQNQPGFVERHFTDVERNTTMKQLAVAVNRQLQLANSVIKVVYENAPLSAHIVCRYNFKSDIYLNMEDYERGACFINKSTAFIVMVEEEAQKLNAEVMWNNDASIFWLSHTKLVPSEKKGA